MENMRNICDILEITEHMRKICGTYAEHWKYAENMRKHCRKLEIFRKYAKFMKLQKNTKYAEHMGHF
jgi:hypothetical protein